MSNAAVRIIVSVIAIPLILFVAFYGSYFFLFFTLFIGLAGYYEFGAMVKKKEILVNSAVGYLSVSALILNQYFKLLHFELLLIAIVLLLLLNELFRNNGSASANLGGSLLGIFYVGLFASAVVGVRELYVDSVFPYSSGGLLIIAVFASIWLCDSAAFFIGTAIGKHKLFPRVSPNKSWEGAIAGFVFAVAAMIAAHFIAIDFLTVGQSAALGIIVGIFGQTGDLVESLIKRDAGVKDSSSLIPGHGGILDRFDSFLFSAPFIFLFMKYFAF
ncbi:MAG: phosphatidate cytidylyltransferase [Chlorobi bacterium]|nr:phosphatidate cytidylyltransferase [Chlorobiota bacterium]